MHSAVELKVLAQKAKDKWNKHGHNYDVIGYWSRHVSWLLMVKSMGISFACSTFSPKNRLKQYTFTSDCLLTLSISLGFSLHRVVHVLGWQWLGAWHCVQWAAHWWGLAKCSCTEHVAPTSDLSCWWALSSRVLTVAPCTCCVNLYVCMYKVSILGVFEYFFITVSLCQYFPVFSVFDF